MQEPFEERPSTLCGWATPNPLGPSPARALEPCPCGAGVPRLMGLGSAMPQVPLRPAWTVPELPSCSLDPHSHTQRIKFGRQRTACDGGPIGTSPGTLSSS